MTDKYLLTEEDLKEIGIIEERWKAYPNKMCEDCVREAIRHWDRNMDPACNEGTYDNENHIDRYDGDIFACGGQDVHTLLNIIKKIQVDKYINNEAIKFIE